MTSRTLCLAALAAGFMTVQTSAMAEAVYVADIAGNVIYARDVDAGPGPATLISGTVIIEQEAVPRLAGSENLRVAVSQTPSEEDQEMVVITRGDGVSFQQINGFVALPDGNLLVFDSGVDGPRLVGVHPHTGMRRVVKQLPDTYTYTHMETGANGSVIFSARSTDAQNRFFGIVRLEPSGNTWTDPVEVAGTPRPMLLNEFAETGSGQLAALVPEFFSKQRHLVLDGGTLVNAIDDVSSTNFASNFQPPDPSNLVGTLDVPVNEFPAGTEELILYLDNFAVQIEDLDDYFRNPTGVSEFDDFRLYDPQGTQVDIRSAQVELIFDDSGAVVPNQSRIAFRLPETYQDSYYGEWTVYFRHFGTVSDPATELGLRLVAVPSKGINVAAGDGDGLYLFEKFPATLVKTTASYDSLTRTVLAPAPGSTFTDTDLNYFSDVVQGETGLLYAGSFSLPQVYAINASTGEATLVIDNVPADLQGLPANYETSYRLLAMGPTPIFNGDMDGNDLVTPGDAQTVFLCYMVPGDCTPDQLAEGDVCGTGGDVTPTDAQGVFNLYMNVMPVCP